MCSVPLRRAGMIDGLHMLRRKLFRPHAEYFGFAMRVAYILMALLVSILLARLLGPAPLGRYYAVVAWILLIGAIVQSGWGAFLVREVAALRELRRYAELRGLTRLALRIASMVSTVTALLFVAIAWVFAEPEIFHLFVIGAPVIVLLSTSNVRQAITRGMGRPLLGQVVDNLTRPGVQLVGLALLASGVIAIPATPLAAMVVFLVAIAASAVLAYFFQQGLMNETQNAEPPVLPPRPEWLGPFLQTAAIGWAVAINLQVGTIVLSFTASDSETAMFRVAQQLSLLLAFGLMVVTTLYANEFSKLFVRKDHDGLQRLATRGALICTGPALAGAVVFAVGGHALIARVYGEPFVDAFAPLMVLIGGQLVNAILGPTGALSIATRNERFAMHAHLWSVAVNLVLCLVLAERWGAIGAALGATVSMSLWNIALFLILRSRVGINASAAAIFTRRRPRAP